MITFEENKIDKGTWIRTIALVITWINMLLSHYGLQPIPVVSDDIIADVLAGAATVATWFWNNYLTLNGKKQKKLLKQHGLTKAK